MVARLIHTHIGITPPSRIDSPLGLLISKRAFHWLNERLPFGINGNSAVFLRSGGLKMETWQYVAIGAFVIVLIRAWFLMGKISRFIDDTDYRDAERFKDRNARHYQ
ncbi:hypothetical protein [Agrobacterium sp. CG674]